MDYRSQAEVTLCHLSLSPSYIKPLPPVYPAHVLTLHDCVISVLHTGTTPHFLYYSVQLTEYILSIRYYTRTTLSSSSVLTMMLEGRCYSFILSPILSKLCIWSHLYFQLFYLKHTLFLKLISTTPLPGELLELVIKNKIFSPISYLFYSTCRELTFHFVHLSCASLPIFQEMEYYDIDIHVQHWGHNTHLLQECFLVDINFEKKT
jgi:hypothetical protein